jgi:hypothetical protein
MEFKNLFVQEESFQLLLLIIFIFLPLHNGHVIVPALFSKKKKKSKRSEIVLDSPHKASFLCFFLFEVIKGIKWQAMKRKEDWRKHGRDYNIG